MKAKLFIESIINFPFQLQWSEVEIEVSIIPYPGFLLRHSGIVLSILNCIYDVESGSLEIYTRSIDVKNSLLPEKAN